jgi:dihydroorotase
MKDQLNVMSKFLALGLSLEDVIAKSTLNPARMVKREDLGHLSVGAPADVAVLSLQTGRFGFVDSFGGRLKADKKLVCELTLRDGKVLYDLNGLARPDWETLPKGYRTTGNARWDGYSRR